MRLKGMGSDPSRAQIIEKLEMLLRIGMLNQAKREEIKERVAQLKTEELLGMPDDESSRAAKE